MKRVVAIVLLLGALQLFGATWYVSPTGAGAKDGTSYANAWEGLLNVAIGPTALTNGDTLYICGTHIYTMTAPPFDAGEIDLPDGVTLRGDYPGDPGVVFGGARWQVEGEDNWQGPDENGVYWNPTIEYGANHYPLRFQIDGTNIIRLNVKATETWTGGLGSAAYINTTNFVKTVDGSQPNGNLASHEYGYYFNFLAKTNITFQSLRFVTRMSQNSKDGQASRITYRNCSLVEQALGFLVVSNDYWTFDGCEVTLADNAIYAYNVLDSTVGAHYLTVTNCYIHDIDTGNYRSDLNDGHAIGIRGCANGYVLTHNRIENTGEAISYFGTGQTNHVVSYNWIRGTHLAYTDGIGINLSGDGIKEGFQIYGNILVDIGTNSVETWQGYGIAGNVAQSILIANNTISNANTGIFLYPYPSGDPHGQIENNIIVNPRESYVYLRGETASDGVTLDYNLYYASSGPPTPFTILPASTQNENSVTGSDPLFIAASPSVAADFRLQSGSPARGAGTAVGLTTDYGGRLWLSPPSMGAWECVGNTVFSGAILRGVSIH